MRDVQAPFDVCLQDMANQFGFSLEALRRWTQKYPYAEKTPYRNYPKHTGTPQERRLMYALPRLVLHRTAAATLLECGIHWGASTLATVTALRHGAGLGTFHAVDRNKTIEGGRPLAALVKDHRELINFHGGIDGIAYIEQLPDVYDYVFEDAAHTYGFTYGFYAALRTHVSATTLLVSHDPFSRPDKMRAIEDTGYIGTAYRFDDSGSGLVISTLAVA